MLGSSTEIGKRLYGVTIAPSKRGGLDNIRRKTKAEQEDNSINMGPLRLRPIKPGMLNGEAQPKFLPGNN